MEETYRDTRRVLLEARNQLEALESACTNTQLDPQASSLVSSSFQCNLQQLVSNSTSLRSFLVSQPPSTRQVWKARLKDLDDQIAELRAGDRRCNVRFRSIRNEKMMRDELFQRRVGAVGGAQHEASQLSGDAVLRMGLVDENRSLKQSGNMMSGILKTGASAMDKLVSQKGRLRNVKTKVLDVLNQVGVDRRIIASIERREYSDTILVYSLMVVMLLLLGLAVLYKYHRKRHAG